MIPTRTAVSRVLVVALFLVGASACGSDESAPFAGARRAPAPALSATLPTADGDVFEFVAAEDEVLLVYFGFTSCPDVCPTTLADVSFARSELGDDGDRVDLAMVTVDPGRDDAATLSDYVNSFVPGSTALRTDDDDELRSAAAEFGVFYEVNTLEDGTIDVIHSGTLFAVDDQGKLTASWSFGTPAGDIVNDLDILLDET